MPPKKIFLDRLDYVIIQELHRNARVAASEIARKAHANERTIRKRIERLVSDGVIRLTAILDPAAFGYHTTADIFLETDPNQEQSILQRLRAMPEVTYIALGQESTEISIEARFKDNEALREFLGRTLPSIPGVNVSRYAIVPRILRNIDEWMPSEEDFSE
ncbi:MAG: AsnC family transcriptional regulator [Anaerolineales bacterium]|nr:AsnC family transcriptional regulator [Anaerolineales bacterium]